MGWKDQSEQLDVPAPTSPARNSIPAPTTANPHKLAELPPEGSSLPGWLALGAAGLYGAGQATKMFKKPPSARGIGRALIPWRTGGAVAPVVPPVEGVVPTAVRPTSPMSPSARQPLSTEELDLFMNPPPKQPTAQAPRWQGKPLGGWQGRGQMPTMPGEIIPGVSRPPAGMQWLNEAGQWKLQPISGGTSVPGGVVGRPPEAPSPSARPRAVKPQPPLPSDYSGPPITRGPMQFLVVELRFRANTPEPDLTSQD